LIVMTRRAFCSAAAAAGRLALRAQPAADSVFTFQNSFWVNLHHFLRGESRRRSVNEPLELAPADLGREQHSQWQRGLDVYAELIKLNLIFDKRLVAIDNTLAKIAGEAELRPGVIEPEIAAVLNEAAPIYRARLWEEHRRANAAWIAAHTPEIRRYSAAVKKAIAAALHTMPPRDPMLVDLARDIGPNLAYTTAGPAGTAGHTVLAPQKNADPDIALNTIFHEISHTMDREFNNHLYGEAERQKVDPPRDLWHAITLYTTWKVAKRELGRGDGYRPDVENAATFERNGWQRLFQALNRYWQPYLDGRVAFEAALRDLVRETSR
jgi:hypothetical protein